MFSPMVSPSRLHRIEAFTLEYLPRADETGPSAYNYGVDDGKSVLVLGGLAVCLWLVYALAQVVGAGLVLGMAISWALARAGRHSSRLWVKALGAVAEPLAIALTFAALLLLAVNLCPGDWTPGFLSRIEEFIVGLNERLESRGLEKWLPWIWVAAIVALVFWNRYLPEWGMLRRGLVLKRWMERFTAVVGIAAHLTFFASGSIAPAINGRARVRYDDARKRSHENKTRHIARAAVKRAFSKAPTGTRAFLARTAEETAEAKVDERVERAAAKSQAEDDLAGFSVDMSGMESDAAGNAAANLRLAEDEEKRAADWKTRADREEADLRREALTQIGNEAASAPRKAAFDALWSIAAGLVETLRPEVGELVKKYGENLTDAAVEMKVTEPASEWILQKWSGRERAAGESLRGEVRFRLRNTALQASRDEAREAMAAAARVLGGRSGAAARYAAEAKEHAESAQRYLAMGSMLDGGVGSGSGPPPVDIRGVELAAAEAARAVEKSARDAAWVKKIEAEAEQIRDRAVERGGK